jgi:ribosomal protein S4
MVVKKPFVWRGLIEMSWDKFNLFNAAKFGRQGPDREINKTAFQLRWRAKQLTSAYSAGHVTQKMFRKHQHKILPRIARSPDGVLPFPPTSTLMYAFMERRADVALFRACFVPSIWDARRLCRNGSVTVNGKSIHRAGYLLEDGDIMQVRPDRIPLLNPELAPKSDVVDAALKTDDSDATADDAKTDAAAEKQKKKGDPFMADKDHGFHPLPMMSPWVFVPEYLEVNYNNLSICFLRSPTLKPGRCEVPSPYDELLHQRTFDFYLKHRRM